jgi:NTP pyrophosphatase (non-canonical NTP hydrolase)
MTNYSLNLLEQSDVNQHSLCPDDLLYNANALAGEVGEVCNQVKKIRMANIRPDWVQQNENSLPSAEMFRERAVDELGDVLFYLIRVAKDLGVTLDQIAEFQIEKLNQRSEKYKRIFLK